MPAQKSAVEIAACRGESEGCLSHVSGAHQPPSISDCFALASLHRSAYTRTTPTRVDRAQQVELLER